LYGARGGNEAENAVYAHEEGEYDAQPRVKVFEGADFGGPGEETLFDGS
jgi:hypothetical protein